MIFITGDTHGDLRRFSTDAFYEQREMTKDDYAIILGDFGMVWDYKGESKYEKESRKQFEDFEVVITEEKQLEHDSFYTAEIPEYGISLTGYDKDELIKIIKEQFKDKQSEYLIRKYLRLDE